MRSHSGKDEARNNLRDPTHRDRDREAELAELATKDGKSTGMGSHARKSAQDGDDEAEDQPIR